MTLPIKRRDLLKGLAVSSLLTTAIMGKTQEPAKTKLIKPKRLSKGDTIGIISPSGASDAEDFEKAEAKLAELGFKTKIGKYAREDNGIYAGTDAQRLEDLHWAFSDRDIKAVWCIRGGYGVSRILPGLDLKLIKKNPKILIGYSDTTALHLAIHQGTGLVTFHGPTGSATFADYTNKHVFNALMNPAVPYRIELSATNIERAKTDPLFKTEVITKGKARGRLTGGNLSLIAALAGTPFAMRDLKGKILFIEDVNEAPYRIDRMMTQLRQNSDLRSLSGIALGVFAGCGAEEGRKTQTVQDVMRDRLGDLGIPVVYGLSIGHIREQFTIPMGIEAELDADNATIIFLEGGVV